MSMFRWGIVWIVGCGVGAPVVATFVFGWDAMSHIIGSYTLAAFVGCAVGWVGAEATSDD